ncbi:MAG TPA: molecular chaperone DnaJ [Gaiellaceae bacterium]|nr:molecular chaperone DnaJ [Gaiellaceae bacterium]
MTRNPYEVLGVAKNASDDEIKKAYRKLAREFHPDRNQGDDAAEERFKEVQGAYDVLSDPEKRKAYDAFGDARAQGFPGGAGGDMGGMRFEEFDLSNLGDLLGGMFGGGGARRGTTRQPVRGNDLETHVRISFEDSLQGVQVRVPVEVDTACSVCHGTGAEPGTSPVTCPQCGGRGVVSDSQGLFAFSQPCPRCRGNGTIVEKPCRHCRGSGRERVTKRYAVKIPAGARSGTRVRLKGKGEAGHAGGPAGDLFVVVDVDPSPLYERRGSDLVLEVPVTYAEAALGASVEIPTPEGPVSLKVPSGTETGKLLRVKGRGAPRLKGNGRGDLLARVNVTVPKKLTKAEREALESYQKVSREMPRERFAEAS